MRTLPFLLILMVALTACDSYEQDAFTPEYVVEAYLIAGEPLPTIKLSQTAPIGARYAFDDYAVNDATVTVRLLDTDGQMAEQYPYERFAKGRYRPLNPATVQPLRKYALEITAPGTSQPVRATTLVPGSFELIATATDTVVYQATEQFETRVTPSEYPGRQSIYVFTLEALDTTNYDLTPFYADLVGDDLDPADLVTNSSGIVNEANFDANSDGSLTLRLPWIAVAFYGPNTLIASAIDDNLYDFLRSQADNGTQSPGELDNLIDHVEGGRGIFGSMARDGSRIFVQPAPGE